MMTIYKNDPKYKTKYNKYLCQKISFYMQFEKYKIRKDNKNPKSRFL